LLEIKDIVAHGYENQLRTGGPRFNPWPGQTFGSWVSLN